MKLSRESCARTTDAVPSDSRQIAGSRRGPAVGGGSSSGVERVQGRLGAAQADDRGQGAHGARGGEGDHRGRHSAGVHGTGSSRAAMAPPRGVDMCRRPRAKPRWVGPNQATTARPLAALALEPNAPAATRQAPSPPAVSVCEAAAGPRRPR